MSTSVTNNEDLIRQAALHLSCCDFLIVAAGAGFSADSGLPTYADVALHPAYKSQGVEYGDLCRISCLLERPSLFYGFWGACFNAYHRSRPHDGYRIIRKWCNRIAQRRALTFDDSASTGANRTGAPYYIYTSNVDGYFRREGFEDNHIHEIHGRIDVWLNLPGPNAEPAPASHPARSFTKGHGGRGVANDATPTSEVRSKANSKTNTSSSPSTARGSIHLQPEFRFDVDNENQEIRSAEAVEEHLGSLCRHDPSDGTVMATQQRFRPAVLMFDDGFQEHDRIGIHLSSDQYQAWEARVEAAMEGNADLKFVVLELGCGTRVPSVRKECEDVVRDTGQRCVGSQQCVHIRINPQEHAVDRTSQDRFESIGISMSALQCLMAIDADIESMVAGRDDRG